jgi:hypothetical protein
VRARLAEIEAELEELGGPAQGAFTWDVEWFSEQMDDMQPEELRALIRNVTERVTLHRRGKGRRGLSADLVEVVPKRQDERSGNGPDAITKQGAGE